MMFFVVLYPFLTLNRLAEAVQQNRGVYYGDAMVMKYLPSSIKLDGDVMKSFNENVLQFFSNGQLYQHRNVNKLLGMRDMASCIQKLKEVKINNASAAYIDAIGKPGAGVMEGNLFWSGSYEACLAIPDAHYCNMKNIFLNVSNQTVPLSYGICTPDVCSVDDITALLQILATIANKRITNGTSAVIIVRSNTDNSFCNVKNPSYSSGAVVMIVISSLLIALSFVGTVVELTKNIISDYQNITDDDGTININYARIHGDTEDDQSSKTTTMRVVNMDDKASFVVKFFTCFSLVRNTKAVLNTAVPNGSITSINGIRMLSISWVVLGHVLYFMAMFGFADNTGYIVKNWMPRFSMQAISNATVSVDTFFLLSGLLVSYLSLKRMEKFGSLPLLRYYLHRYIRLTPSYAYLIFFMTFLFPYLGYGPNWKVQPDPMCKSKWWTNLIYINNMYPASVLKQCYGVAWYLAIDMQYYIISPIILYCMYKFKWRGVLGTGIYFFLQNTITNGVLVQYYHASPVFTLDDDNTDLIPSLQDTDTPASRYQDHIYFKTYTRFGPYMVGLILGFILFYKKTVPAKLRPFFYLIGWLVAIATGLSVVYGPYANNKHASDAVNVLYSVLFRTVWAMAVSWVIYACHNGYGSLINSFLSWRVFIPLSRMTYGVYLIHIYVILFFGASLQTPFHVTEVTLSFLFIGVLFISYMLSFLVSVFIEGPVFNLEQLIESQIKKTKTSTRNNYTIKKIYNFFNGVCSN